MPSKQRHPAIPQNPVPPVPTTIFYRLPQSHQQQLAYLVASLIRRVHATRQSKEGKHEH